MKIKMIATIVACYTAGLVGCSSDDAGKPAQPGNGQVDAGSDVVEDSSSSECVSIADCVVPAGPCAACDGGPVACPMADCVEGVCVVSFPTCDDVDGGLGVPEASPDPMSDAATE